MTQLYRQELIWLNTLAAAAMPGYLQISTHPHSLSWQFQVLKLVLEARRAVHRWTYSDKAVLSPDFIIKKRVMEERWAGLFKPWAPITREPFQIRAIPAEWVASTATDQTGPVILYLHGGAFTGGSIASHRAHAGNLAQLTRGRVLLIAYRLAPEHPFPASLEDCLTAYRWLRANTPAAKNIFLAGDSAGATLTLSTLLALRDNAEPLPTAAACLSPVVDFTCAGDGWNTHVPYELFVTEASARRSFKLYLGNTDPRNPLASPLYASLAGLPPLFIQAGAREVLLTDATRFAEKARQAGVEVTLDIWEGMVHAWQLAASFLPEARGAVEKVGAFINAHNLAKA